MKWKIILPFCIFVYVALYSLSLISEFVFILSNTEEVVSPVDMNRFADVIDLNNDREPVIADDVLKEILNNKGWVQFINEYGSEIKSINKPSNIPKQYAGIQQKELLDNLLSIGQFNINIRNYTIFYENNIKHDYKCIIAIPLTKQSVPPQELIFQQIKSFDMKKTVVSVLYLPLLILFGYLFSRRVSKPMKEVSAAISRLTNGDYTLSGEKGLFKDVNLQLNKLAEALQANNNKIKDAAKTRQQLVVNVTSSLSSIKSSAEILSQSEEYLETEKKIEYANLIIDKSNEIDQLLNTYLNSNSSNGI